MQKKVIEIEIVSPNLDETDFQNAIKSVKEKIQEIYSKKGNVAVDVYEATNVLYTGGFSFGNKIEKCKRDIEQHKCPGDYPPQIQWTCQSNEIPSNSFFQSKKDLFKEK